MKQKMWTNWSAHDIYCTKRAFNKFLKENPDQLKRNAENMVYEFQGKDYLIVEVQPKA